MLVTSANELVICVFGSLDLGTTKSKSCLFREMCRYDDNEGEERRSGGEVKREAGVSCAMDGKETTVTFECVTWSRPFRRGPTIS